MSKGFHKKIKPARKPLTPREADVLRVMAHADDSSDKGIAALLGVSWRTVDKHMDNIRKKLHCRTRTSAVVKWLKQNIALTALLLLTGCLTTSSQKTASRNLPPLPPTVPLRMTGFSLNSGDTIQTVSFVPQTVGYTNGNLVVESDGITAKFYMLERQAGSIQISNDLVNWHAAIPNVNEYGAGVALATGATPVFARISWSE